MASIASERLHQTGRGRQADAPQQIPARGWKDVLFRTFKEVGEDRVTLIAAGVTYFLLLALFPTVSAMVSVYGIFADPSTVQDHMAALQGVVPAGGLEIINEQLTRLTTQETPALGFALIISLGLALWGASSGVKSLFEAMNIAYDETESRNFFVLNAIALLFTLAGVIGALVMIGVVVAIPVVLGFLGLGEGLEWLVRILGYALLVATLLVGLAVLYRFGPSRQQAKWRWVTPGALLAVFVITVVSALFSWYTANFGNYDETYGSLGALIAFLFWVWISVNAVIVGAELNAELERQTAADSTVGGDEPLGQREANVADTLGRSTQDETEDDPRAGKDPEWVAGFEEGRKYARSNRKPLPLRYAVPAALAVTLMGSKKGE